MWLTFAPDRRGPHKADRWRADGPRSRMRLRKRCPLNLPVVRTSLVTSSILRSKQVRGIIPLLYPLNHFLLLPDDIVSLGGIGGLRNLVLVCSTTEGEINLIVIVEDSPAARREDIRVREMSGVRSDTGRE